jgi:hypothetical protein
MRIMAMVCHDPHEPAVDARLVVLRLVCDALDVTAPRDVQNAVYLAQVAGADMGYQFAWAQRIASMGPLYSVGTWEPRESKYTPQKNLGMPSINITRQQLRGVMRRLQDMGYTCHRYREPDGKHEDTDVYVLIERTDGMALVDILTRWER